MNKYIIIGAIAIVAYLYLSKKKSTDTKEVAAPAATPATTSEATAPVASVSSKAVEPAPITDVNSSASTAHDQLVTPPSV